MTTKEVKKKLWGYQKAKEEHKRLQRKIEEIETQIMSLSIDYSKDKVQATTDAQDKLANVMDRLSKLREDAINKAAEEGEKMLEVYNLIDSVSDPLQKNILQRKYIEGLTWEEVCYKIGYSWTQTHEHHKRALEGLGKML